MHNDTSSATVQREKLPIGMIILLILIGMGIFTSLLILKNPAFMIGPFLIKGLLATLYSIVLTVILGAMFIGILKRKKWARKLTIAWYIFHMVFVIVNLFFSFMAKKNIIQLYKMQDPQNPLFPNEKFVMTFTVITHIFSFIAMIIVIVYIYSKKEYFKN